MSEKLTDNEELILREQDVKLLRDLLGYLAIHADGDCPQEYKSKHLETALEEVYLYFAEVNKARRDAQ